MRAGEARIECAAPEDEKLHAGIAVVFTKTRVVGRAFVAKLGDGRQRRVMGEVRGVGKHGAQNSTGGRVLQAAVEFAVEVGGGEMHLAVPGVGAGADGAGVGGPHAGRRATGHQQRHGLTGCLGNDLRIAAGKTDATQGGHVRAFLRGEHALLEAHFHQRLHFRQALLGGLLRIGHLLAVALGGHVAVRQAAIVMGRAYQAVEVHFIGSGCGHRLTPGVRVAGRLKLGLSSEATGYAQ